MKILCLLLNVLDKYVPSKYCSSWQTFTDSLVCSSISNRECMFNSCSFCNNFSTERMKINITDDNVKIGCLVTMDNEHGRAEKKTGFQEMLVDEAVLLLLKSKVEYVLFYVYIKRE